MATLAFDINAIQPFVNLLSQTLNPSTQKQAEETLRQLELTTPNFPQLLLSISSGSNGVLEAHVRLAASLFFKNFCKRHWDMEGTMVSLTEEDRLAIKQIIVELITRVPANIQSQLCEAVTLIAHIDFPGAWPELLGQLVSRLNAADFDNNIVILRTIHRCFKHYRTAFRSDELFTEINYVLSQLAAPLLEMYKAVDALLEANANNAINLEKLLRMQLYMNKIFLSLSSQDLPAFFEDHLVEFMDCLKKQLLYSNPLVQSKSDDDAGPGEKVPTSVARIAILYATRYEDDFPMLSQFVEAAWSVLTSVSRLPKHDDLASTCMRLLSSVAKQERHKSIFAGVLQLLCDKVIVPNVLIRDCDLEVFEDEPIEYVRRDVEGSIEEEGRRAGVISLARGLMEFYETEVTAILLNYIEEFLKIYTMAPSQKWRDKNAAVQLFTSIAVKGKVSSLGVTRVNPLVNILDFYEKNILPDLQPANAALHPLLKVDAIKFVFDFRSHLGKDRLMGAFPLLQHHLASHHVVVHTFTAIAFDRILSVKIQQSPLFSGADVAPMADGIMGTILRLIEGHKTVEKMAENDFLIKALLRVMVTAQRDVLMPIMDAPLRSITSLIGLVSKNPSNPVFTHGLFECAAALIKYCGGVPEGASKLEAALIPVLQGILRDNVTELLHYVFQLLAVLLESRPDGSGLVAGVRPLIGPILQPALWTSAETIPALTRLLQAAISKEPMYFVQNNLIITVFGIFQTLMNSKTHDIHAFSILFTILQSVPIVNYDSLLSPAVVLMLKKLQSQRSPRIATQMLLFISVFIYQGVVSQAPSFLLRLFDGLQPKLLASVMTSMLLPQAVKVRDHHDRKLIMLALTKFATECPELLEGDSTWMSLFASIIGCLCQMATTMPVGGAINETPAEDVPVVGGTEADGEGTGSFWRLRVAPPPRKCPTVDTIPQATPIFINSLVAFSRSQPSGRIASILQSSMDPASQQALSSLLQQYSVSL